MKKKRPNYLDRVLDLGAEAKKGTLTMVSIRHDDWCGIFRGGDCDCDPDVVPGDVVGSRDAPR